MKKPLVIAPTSKNQGQETAGDMALHSVIIGVFIFGYMMMFGHGLPTEFRGPGARQIKRRIQRVRR